MDKHIIIGIAGGSGSGKTSVAKALVKDMHLNGTVITSYSIHYTKLYDGLVLQVCQMDVDAGQGLGDFIMQFAADLPALLLLRLKQLAGQVAQLSLHELGLLQQLSVVLLAFPEGFLDHPALDNFLFQSYNFV